MTMTTDPQTTDPQTIAADDTEAAVGALAERLFGALIDSWELSTIELGLRLGLYEALAAGPATPPQLAERAHIDARYAREWLEQQATAGMVAVDVEPVSGQDADDRVFSLPAAQQVCLLDQDSLAYLAPLAKFGVAGGALLPQVVEAYRTGRGLTFGEYGDDIRIGQSLANRPQFLNLLASDWLPAMPDVVERLERGEARVADIGCGTGWSSIAIGRAFPRVTIDGYDLDEPSIADAQANAKAEGLADRISFEVRNAADAAAQSYDLVCCFESLHDMARPVEVLAAMRSMLAPGGTVFIVDERAADEFTADDPDPLQRFLYAASVLHCLLVGRSEEPSAGTGTVFRTATLDGYAADAGFSSVEVLPVEHDMFRFYRLHV